MSRNIFKLSFEDSTKIVQSRSLIEDFFTFDSTTKITWKNSNNNFFNRLIFTLVCAGFCLGLFAAGILFDANSAADFPIQGVNLVNAKIAINIRNQIRPALTLIFIFALLMDLIQLLPTPNFAWQRRICFNFLALLCIQVMISAIPMGFGLMLQHWGKLASHLGIIFIVAFFVLYPINEIFKKRYLLTGKGNYAKLFPIIKCVGIVWLICIFLALITNFDGIANLFVGSIFFILEISFCIIFYLVLDGLLTYHYMLKYPKQYRIYYRIRDDAWWMSTRKANKHEHVYPVPKKQNSK